MDNVLPIRSAKDEAGDWLARLEAEDVTGEDRRAFAQWQAADGRHRQAFQDVEAASKRIDALLSHAVQSQASPQTRRKPLALAAAAALVALALGFFWFHQTSTSVVSYASTVGEVRSIALPDGSKLQLNTDSRVEVHYKANQRLIRLQQGEALFTVARDPARPFTVQAGEGFVKALGTAFTVRLGHDDAVQVLVTEGRVEVTTGREESAQLTGGQGIRYGAALDAVKAMKPEEIGRSLAWREGMLLFEGEKLAQVLEEVGRYTQTELRIADPELRDMSVYGYFKANDLETFLRRLEANFPIEVHRDPHGIRLKHKAASDR